MFLAAELPRAALDCFASLEVKGVPLPVAVSLETAAVKEVWVVASFLAQGLILQELSFSLSLP